MENEHLQKAATRGEPSYVWRAGQERRLRMVQEAAAKQVRGRILVDGCGLGAYVTHLEPTADHAVGIDIEIERTREGRRKSLEVVCGAAEHLPFPCDHFDLVLSHEMLEHVEDDLVAIQEIIRTLRPGGRLVLFCPNRGYPFETHGHYWRGRYYFGNTPLINYLPRPWRDKLAPHVRVYSRSDLEALFSELPVRFIKRTIIFGAYDNIIARLPAIGRLLRSFLQALESTPLRIFGLSHFWVVEKVANQE